MKYKLIYLGHANAADARQVSGDAFDELFDLTYNRLQPSILLTYSGWLPEFERRARVKALGTRVVFAPHNPLYIRRVTFENADAVFCASGYMAAIAKERLGVLPSVLPVPIASAGIVAPVRQPAFVGFINPEPLKGVAVFARIVEQVSKRRPEIPFLVVNARQQGDVVAAIGRREGLDLSQANILVADPMAEPANLYAVMRLLLVPSLEESAGRVARRGSVERHSAPG